MSSDSSKTNKSEATLGKKNEILFRFRSLVIEFVFKASDIAVHPRILIFIIMSLALGAIFCFIIDLAVNAIAYAPLVNSWVKYWELGPALGIIISWLIFIRNFDHKSQSLTESIDAPNLALVQRYLQSIPEKERSLLISIALMEDLKKRKDVPAPKAKPPRTETSPNS